MFQTLYLLNYNNYYNRLVKKEETLSDYLEYEVATLAATNFNPNDHVMTEHTVNIDDDISPDYAILVDQSANIVSRWFVIESTRVRGGQYKLQLYRDTVVDYYNIILNSYCFIEKAMLQPTDKLIFNNENMTYNQVLKSSTPLMDKSGCAWIVGYYDKDSGLEGNVQLNDLTSVPHVELSEETFTKLQNGETTPIVTYPTNRYFVYNTLNYAYSNYGVGTSFWISPEGEVLNFTYNATGNKPSLYLLDYDVAANTVPKIKNLLTTEKLSSMVSDMPAYIKYLTKEETDYISSLNGSLIKNHLGEYYTVSIIPQTEKQFFEYVPSGSLYNNMKSISDQVFMGQPNDTSFYVSIDAISYNVVLTRQQQYETSYNIPADPSQKLITMDAPYNVFAIPYSDDLVIKTYLGEEITANKDIAINTAMSMSKKFSGGGQGSQTAVLYDVQLLPYCPVKDLIINDKEMFISDAKQISYITVGEGDTLNKIGIIFNIPKSHFENNIPYTIPIGVTAIERKVNNECDKWRLTSPNYSNYFDFSAEKNEGVQYFNIDCNYRPYTPYIHINPNFNGLYGFDDNSPRGLVLGGDFSLPQITDAWNQYQIQNKNFQNIFDRQIQNMEVNNGIQRTRDIVSAVAGTAQGAASGAFTGAMVPGMKAGVGAAIGAGVSLAAGVTDVILNEVLRNEAIDYTKDLFGYQLGNIQALPATISKVSAFNANNKIFPVLEYYTATDVEKEALRNKIKYNGMTVMTIGLIDSYVQNKPTNEPTYIKGQMIRLENLDNEYHLAQTIAKEINQGIYI